MLEWRAGLIHCYASHRLSCGDCETQPKYQVKGSTMSLDYPRSEALEMIAEIADLSRRALSGPEDERWFCEMHACYLMGALAWTEEELFDESTSADIEERCSGMLRAVWSDMPKKYGSLDIGYAAGLTCVWPLAEGVVDRFIEDPDFGWMDIDANCVDRSGRSLDLYLDNVVNFPQVISNLFPGYQHRVEKEGTEATKCLLRHLARHMGDFLPSFAIPESREARSVRMIAIIDETSNDRFTKQSRRTSETMSDGQRMVRSIGMRRLPSNSQWSKFWYDYGQPGAFAVDAKQRQYAVKFARMTGKCRN